MRNILVDRLHLTSPRRVPDQADSQQPCPYKYIFSAEEDKKEEEHLHIHPVCFIQCVAAPPFTCVTE